MRQPALAWIVVAASLLLAGCLSAPGGSTPAAGPTATRPAPTLDLVSTSTVVATVVETPPGVQSTTLTVWLPEGFEPGSASLGGQALAEQVTAFDQIRPDIQVEFYPKRVQGPGGIIGYLRSAPPVAAGVLPDLTLLDRDALVEVTRDKLIVPIAALVDPAVVQGLYPVAREVGTVDDELAGLPYLLEIDHAVYRETTFRQPPLSFQKVLEARQPLVMAAAATGGVNSVLLLQYLAAGGVLADEQGHPALDAPILAGVLVFYDKAHKLGVFDTGNFQAINPQASWAAYRDQQVNLAAVTSTLVLAEESKARNTGLMPVPTADGKPFTLVRGWSWVIVAHDPQQQAAAMALVNFLMNPVNHGRYSEAAGWLPSQPGALAVWGKDHDAYTAFAGKLLDSGVPMPDASVRSTVGVAIQDAFEAVLLKDVSPEQAATQAAAAVKNAK